MAKKSFTAGGTKTGILNSDGGEKLKEIQAKTQYNFKYIPKDKIVSNPKMKCMRRMALMHSKKVYLLTV